jgi:hypothetical protein
MKRNTNEIFFQLVALMLAIIMVHAAYVTVVRPNADSTINRAAEVAAAGGEYVVPRSFFVVIKDFEQEACFVLMLWALAIMGYKTRTAMRESRMLDMPLVSVSEGTRILPGDAGQLARPLQSLPERQQEYLLPRALSTALARFQVTSSVESATEAAHSVCESESNRLDSELSIYRRRHGEPGRGLQLHLRRPADQHGRDVLHAPVAADAGAPGARFLRLQREPPAAVPEVPHRMTLAALELNDQSLLIRAEDGSLHAEPGFANLTEEGIVTGEEARAVAWRAPQHVYNQYWCHLSQAPLPSRHRFARHHGDIAYAQLRKLWQHAGSPESLILLAPASFSREQLSLLLGMVEALPARPCAIIDSALAACLTARADTLYVDLQMHDSVLSVCRPENGATRIVDQEILPGLGMVQIQNAVALAQPAALGQRYFHQTGHRSGRSALHSLSGCDKGAGERPAGRDSVLSR